MWDPHWFVQWPSQHWEKVLSKELYNLAERSVIDDLHECLTGLKHRRRRKSSFYCAFRNEVVSYLLRSLFCRLLLLRLEVCVSRGRGGGKWAVLRSGFKCWLEEASRLSFPRRRIVPLLIHKTSLSFPLNSFVHPERFGGVVKARPLPPDWVVYVRPSFFITNPVLSGVRCLVWLGDWWGSLLGKVVDKAGSCRESQARWRRLLNESLCS